MWTRRPHSRPVTGRFLDRNEWAVGYLRLIARRPAVVSTVLAAEAGEERLFFKPRVRKLKALGLTESLDVGYRISPRGQAVLDSRGPIPGSNR